MPLQYDPDFFEKAKDLLATIAAAPPPEDHDVEARRRGLTAFLGAANADAQRIPEVEISKFTIKSFDGIDIAVHRFVHTPTKSLSAPAVVHFHGGGMVFGSVESFFPSLEARVFKSGVQFFSVDYRVAPENPYPTPVEDCYAGLRWVSENASDLGVDSSRIAVMGESAGGGLAAGVALMARDRQLSRPLAKQILIYPMLDASVMKPVEPELEKHLFWTIGSNITGWTAYLGDKLPEMLSSGSVPEYASPAFAKSLEGLPPTYIDVGGLDLFRDEDITFASRLMQANVTVEFHLYPGLPHAFESFSVESKPYLLAQANRIRAMQSI